MDGALDYANATSHCTRPAGPQVTPAMVLQEVRRIGLPKPALSIQPPGGKTLVNFPTIFSTTAAPIDRTLTLVGIQVQVRIEPTSYAWDFGNGQKLTTTTPGRPWKTGMNAEDVEKGLRNGFVTHEYVDAHVTVSAHVDVTYAAQFRVGGGPWQDVGQTVTVSGPPASLRIVEARPVLVG